MNRLTVVCILLCSIVISVSDCAVSVRHNEGFVAGTAIKTSKGYAAIEDLKEGDYVISYDHKHHNLQEDAICKIVKQDLDYIIEIIVDGVQIRAGPDQKFYRRSNGVTSWVMTQDLQINDFILIGHKRWSAISRITRMEEDTTVYTISTLKYQNFFVSDHDILTHNIVFVLGAIAAFDLVVEIAAPAIAFGAICLYCKLTGKKLFCPFTIKPPNDNDWHHILKNNRHDHGFDGKDPKKIWDDAQMILMAAMSRDELMDNTRYTVSGVTEYGLMEIQGIVLDGVVRISTMYMKGGQ